MNHRSKHTLILIISLIALTNSYQLEFDWGRTDSAKQKDLGYVTWNGANLLTLSMSKDILNQHQVLNVDFVEGQNQLSFFYIGANGNITLDNVQLTAPSSSINIIVNGDFQMPVLTDNDKLFSDKIPGWTNNKLVLAQKTDSNQVLVFTPQIRTVTQSITFGKTSKYSFLSSINTAIQNQAMGFISQNLQTLQASKSPTFGQNYSTSSVWSTNSAAVNSNYNNLINKSNTTAASNSNFTVSTTAVTPPIPAATNVTVSQTLLNATVSQTLLNIINQIKQYIPPTGSNLLGSSTNVSANTTP